MLLKTIVKNLFTISFVTLIGSGAWAETSMVVMNYQAVLFESAAAQDATLQLRESVAVIQNQAKEIQVGIETRQNSLEIDKDILTEEEVEQFTTEIQALVTEQQRLSQQIQLVQQQSRNEFVQNNQPNIAELVAAFVAENSIDLVLDAQAVLFNASVPDITEDILGIFDNQYLKTVQPTQENSN